MEFLQSQDLRGWKKHRYVRPKCLFIYFNFFLNFEKKNHFLVCLIFTENKLKASCLLPTRLAREESRSFAKIFPLGWLAEVALWFGGGTVGCKTSSRYLKAKKKNRKLTLNKGDTELSKIICRKLERQRTLSNVKYFLHTEAKHPGSI